MTKKYNFLKNILITLSLLTISSVIGGLFSYMDIKEHVSTIFIFGIFLISLMTEGYLYGIFSAFCGMFIVNYVFTYPYYAFNFNIPNNLISALVMVSIAILTNMLTTKIKEQEITKAEAEAERMRANLLRAVSHDLRTPLTTIYSATTTLRNKGQALTQAQKDSMLLHIQEDSEWLVRMVENLLSVTRIDNQQIRLKKTPTILDELIDSVMTKFSSRYPQQEVNVEIPDKLIMIPIDTLLMEQVLINLLENALFHANGMTMLQLKVTSENKLARFQVIDNGSGIEADILPHIFDHYSSSATKNTAERNRHFGIGLPLCSTIIRAHGGKISANNRPEGGAVFSFTLTTEEIDYDE